MYGKIALLERVVKDILINGFLTSPIRSLPLRNMQRFGKR